MNLGNGSLAPQKFHPLKISIYMVDDFVTLIPGSDDDGHIVGQSVPFLILHHLVSKNRVCRSFTGRVVRHCCLLQCHW